MTVLSCADLLTVWEQGSGLHSIDRALLLLMRGCRECTHEALAQVSLGQRDTRLLRMRRELFGDLLDARAECPQCQERVECSMSCQQLLAEAVDSHPPEATLTVDGIELRLRVPDSRDLALAATRPSVAAARRLLLERCVTPANTEGFEIEVLSEAAQALIADQLAASDPRAEILLNLSCPACGHGWQMLFDIAAFLWAEVSTQAKRVLQQIDLLARTYGWTEAEVLRLSERRRGWYVEMALS